MTQKQINRLIKLLKGKGISFDKGLNDAEINQAETVFDIHFPEDLKAFLQTELPISDGFVHWRYGINSEEGKQQIEYRLNWPEEGLLFDIKHNTFWLDKWGKKPETFEVQKNIAIAELAKQPKLIPVFSHRYIPSEPNESGNPIFSVYQMDIIHYGMDLADYFSNEFNFELPSSFGEISTPKRIKFWSKMVDLNT